MLSALVRRIAAHIVCNRVRETFCLLHLQSGANRSSVTSLGWFAIRSSGRSLGGSCAQKFSPWCSRTFSLYFFFPLLPLTVALVSVESLLPTAARRAGVGLGGGVFHAVATLARFCVAVLRADSRCWLQNCLCYPSITAPFPACSFWAPSACRLALECRAPVMRRSLLGAGTWT